MNDNRERRRFSRLPFEIDTSVRIGGRGISAHLVDVSIRGALIAHPAGWDAKPGEKGVLTVILSESTVVITMEVEVAHVEPETIGLHCTSIDVDSMTHLRRMMELNLGDPNLVERELAMLG